jgi:hypothetical protein
VKELIAGERLVMGTTDGPIAVETTYTWEDEPGGRTRMRLRDRGETSGVASLASPTAGALQAEG